MNYYRFPDNKLVKLCFPLFFLALQMVARSTMYTSTFLGFTLSQCIMLGLVVVIGLAFLLVNRKNLKNIFTDSRVILAVLCATAFLLPMVLKRDWQLMYFTMLLCAGFGILASFFITLREAAGYYVRLMFFLSACTLVGQLILKPLVNAGFLPGFPFESPGGWYMYNFGLTFAVDQNNLMMDALRLFGIFREPGLYQIFLFIALHLNNYNVDWDKEWKRWTVNAMLFLCLLLTFATGGVAAMAMYIVFLFFDKGMYKDKRLRVLAIVLVVAVAVLLAAAIAMDGTWAMELLWMIQKVFLKTDSYTTRLESVIMDAQIFLRSPLVGAKVREVLYSVSNNTASSPILFAILGILGGMLHVASWVALVWKKERHWIGNLILLVIVFIPFNTQNVVHDMFFWLFPILALTEQLVPRMDVLRAKKKG